MQSVGLEILLVNAVVGVKLGIEELMLFTFLVELSCHEQSQINEAVCSKAEAESQREGLIVRFCHLLLLTSFLLFSFLKRF